MSFAAPTAVYASEPFVRRTSMWTFLRSHIFILNVLSLFVVGFLVLAYIVQVNSSISKGYQIRELEIVREQLSLQNQQLEVNVREAQSLERVARSVKMLGFVDAKLATYVVSGAPSVALAQ